MSEIKSYRKPYTPKVEFTWWTKVPYLTRYMLREGTCVMALFVCCELLLGIFLFAMCNLVDNPTEADVAPYLWWVNSFVGNPLVMLLNLAALGATLFHTVTWFALMPKSMRVFMNKNTTELVPDMFMIGGLYGALAGCTLVILVVAFATIP